MKDEVVQLKTKLPSHLIEQIKEVTDAQLSEVLRASIVRFINIYATEQMVSSLVTQYIEKTEELFEDRIDKITNLLASLSYVSKFNNNILNAIFVNNNGSEADLERFYNEATDTVQKYFQFEETEENILPIMAENDELKTKVQELEKREGSATSNPSNSNPKQQDGLTNQLPDDKAQLDATIRRITDQVVDMEAKKAEAERQKREVIVWINGLITHLINNYSRLHNNEQTVRNYIKKNPKPKIQ